MIDRMKFPGCVIIVCGFMLVAMVFRLDAQSEFDFDRINRATVYIIQTRGTGDNVITCVGTGTIINRAGLIITNAHNTVPNENCPGQSLVIALTQRTGEPPIPTYRAEIAQADIGLDLALLRITRNLDGRLIEPGSLALPFVELGDSSAVRLDDTITVIGYPNPGSAPVAAVRGTAIGFITEPSARDRAWVKFSPTEDSIPGTMSGGGAYNRDGQLIGIPTTVPITSLVPDATCVILEDTNRDNLVNRSDSCVPIGGFINALRPSAFVRPLVRAASLDIYVEKLTEPNFIITAAANPSFSRLFFATAVSDGMPTNVVDILPAGITSLFLFFDYENMTPETVYELRVTTNNIPNPTFSLAPVRWSGGERGLWYIGTNEQVWVPGTYEFTLFINGLATGSARILIGGAPAEEPAFSNVFFCISDGGNCFGTVYVLPTGNQVTARFNFRNMLPSLPWTAIWYYNGVAIPGGRVDDTWQDGTNGSKEIPLAVEGGLLPGRYRLELYIEREPERGVLSAMSEFTIAGAREGAFPRVFSNVRLVSAATPNEAASASGIRSFPTGTREVYALFDWEQIAPGTLWTLRWSVDNEIFFEETLPWNSLETGQNYLMRLAGVDGLPDGTYSLDLIMSAVPLSSIQGQVGIGQLPIDRFASVAGVQLRGQIVDAETNEGIPGVTFILISEDFSVSDFVWDRRQIYAFATTDRNGRFQLDRPLDFGAPYSVVISAQGYLPITADGVRVTLETPNPLDIVIPLTRD